MVFLCDDHKIIHTFVVVVVVELCLESRWLLNEIPTRGGRACNGSKLCINKYDSRNYKNCTYPFVVVELRLETKMAAFNYLALLLFRLLALEKEVCWNDGVFIVMVCACTYAYMLDGNNQCEHWVWILCCCALPLVPNSVGTCHSLLKLPPPSIYYASPHPPSFSKVAPHSSTYYARCPSPLNC